MKWIGLSRSLWSMILPILALVLNQAGVTGADEIGKLANVVFTGGLGITAAVLQFLHQRSPQLNSAAKQ